MTSKLDATGRAVMFMPSPSTLKAPAVWVTAHNWARGLERRFGQVVVCMPGTTELGADVLEPMTRAGAAAPPSAQGPRRPAAQHLRVLAKDLLLLRQRSQDDRRYLSPAGEPAVVWQHHDFMLRAGSRLADHHGTPLIHFVDAPQVWEARRWAVERPVWGDVLEAVAERPQLRRASVLACVSRDVADAVACAGGDPRRILVTPCTADPDRFDSGQDRLPARQRLGWRGEEVVFGWVGSFRRFHGLADAVEAFSIVARDVPSARLLLVGDGAQRSFVEAQVRESGLSDRVVLTGAVPHADVPAHIAAMDVALVTAARADDFHYSPLKLREYLVSGTAVIAPRAGQVAAELRDGEHAMLYDVGDVGSLAETMRQLAADGERRRQLGRAGRTHELSTNSIGGQIEQVLTLAASLRTSPVEARRTDDTGS